VAWAIGAMVAVELAVCSAAAAPVVMLWLELAEWTTAAPLARAAALATALVPSYLVFALLLMALSALATWLTAARTPEDAALCVRDMEWPLLHWARYMVANHIVRTFAAPLFRGSPIWTAYLRLNGARIGRGVYINTLAIADHNLLDLGDDVIIGADVHISGHTIEGGLLKTGRVTLAKGAGIGLGSALSIDIKAGPGCQVGALSFVPKHSRLESDSVYVGIPVRKLDASRGGGSHGRHERSTTPVAAKHE
jgi:serine acetyltransferase